MALNMGETEMTLRKVLLTLAVATIGMSPAMARHAHHDEDEDSDRHRECKEPLTDRGSQWVTEKGAEKAAEKSWTQSVRFKWGEEYADISNARDIKYECAKSSIGTLFKRCEVTATPCRPEVKRVHEEHREKH